MHLTQFSDYSLRLAIYLACHPERVISVDEVSRAFGISRHHLVKVVQMLTDLGVVEAHARPRRRDAAGEWSRRRSTSAG